MSIEDDDSRGTAQRAAVHAIARISVAVVFVYHGIVPKLLVRSPDELAMLTDSGVPGHLVERMVAAIGIAEVLWGILIVVLWRHRWPLVITIGAMVLTLCSVAIHSPRFLVDAFNPVSLNVTVGALAAIGLLSAGECSQKRNNQARSEDR